MVSINSISIEELDRKIAERVSRAMIPLYWIVGGSMLVYLTIFITIALPIQARLIEVSNIQQTKASKEYVDKKITDIEASYLSKGQYYQVEVDEHRVLKEILRDPAQINYLMEIINDNIHEKLLGVSRGADGVKSITK